MPRALITGQAGHVFAQQRPSHTGDYTLNGQQIRVTTFRDLPPPTGLAPYRLDLKDVVAPAVYQRILDTKRLSFQPQRRHRRDRQLVPQQLVAAGMEADLSKGVLGW